MAAATDVSEMEFVDVEPVLGRLSKDMRAAAAAMSEGHARYLVDLYYENQEKRIRAANQVRAGIDAEEPSLVVDWLRAAFARSETVTKSVLKVYAENQRVGRWLLSVHGIGPVIAAGLMAHIDIEKAPTVGHVWRFAGLDPTLQWERGQKRPFNAELKVICWKAGQSFMKLRGNEKDVYGAVYAKRKAIEIERNEAGEFAEQAAAALERKKFGKHTQARGHYEAGRLSPAHIDARARRYAVKLFLAHVHHVMFEDRFGTPPPKPYVVEHLGHAHITGPQGWPCE